MYADRGLSTYEIGRMVGRNPKNVYEKLREFGIPTRPRGLNLSLSGRDNFVRAYMAQHGHHPHLGRALSPEARENMSRAAPKERPWLRGHRNGMHGRTGALNPRYVDGSSPHRQRVYVSAAWKTVRLAVLARDERRCRRCRSRTKIVLHHLRPWAGNPALRLEVSNIVVLCGSCHRWVHSRKNVRREWLA